MMRFLPLFLIAIQVQAQDNPAVFRARVHSADKPVQSAVVRSGDVATRTDSAGFATLRLAPGSRLVTVMRLGFVPDSLMMTLASGADTTIDFELRPAPSSLSAVIVTSTRAERRLEDEPLRIEVLAGEDVSEKAEMHPGDLRTLFRELSGVRVQTTSPSLGAATVRVQGLRGRYTSVLSDGLPLYGAYASGFGLVQQQPLDLRQVEVIKGAASALYGPSAMGGVVNLVSRRPPDTSQAMLSQTANGGTDALAFVARSLSSPIGITTLAGVHYQKASDKDGDNWSDVAGSRRVELRPRLFYQDRAGRTLMVTLGAFAEERAGGPMLSRASLAANADSLVTRHGDAGAVARFRLSGSWSVAFRTSANIQTRRRVFSETRERERQQTIFGEATATGVSARNTLLAGLGWQREIFSNAEVPRFDQALTSPAVFAQHSFTPTHWISSTLNARCDGSRQYGTICTPRLSVLARRGDALNVRASIGSGWSAPAPLNEETEVIGLSHVSRPAPLIAERARTASVDVTAIRGPAQINGTLFASRVMRPVVLRPLAGSVNGDVELVNAPGALRMRGAELFAVFNREPVIATVYYSITHGREVSPETSVQREVPLTPRQEAGLDFALEEDETGAYLAFELFYTGRQALDDNPYRSISPPFTTMGLLGSKRFGRVTAFLNLENLTNVRQSRFDPIVRLTPGPGGTRAVPAWAPLEGRSGNAGFRYAF